MSCVPRQIEKIGFFCLVASSIRANPAHEDINWSYAPSGFVEGVQKAGGLAILLPVSDPSEAKTYISMIDKLILIGGQNIDPKFYNEENHACDWFSHCFSLLFLLLS